MKFITAGDIDFACQVLKRGELLAFPTDTVYGVGGNAFSDDVVFKIFQCKHRSRFNPISVCYPSFYKSSEDVEINEKAEILADNFLPGALTIILKRTVKSRISWLCSAGKESVGIRVPDNPVAISLLNKLDFPLAAPSANRSSELTPTTAQAVRESLKYYEKLVILDAGKCNFGIESTIVDLSGDCPKILRKGAISREEIEDECKFRLIVESNSKFNHYKPKKYLRINVSQVGENDALLAFGNPINGAKYCLNLSESSDLSEAAKNLFSMLRDLDSTDADKICVMPIPDIGIGQAINDRLEKATDSA